MIERKVIRYRSSAMIRCKHPTDVDAEPNEPLNNTGDGATCSFKVYDPNVDENLTADEASGQQILSVSNPANFNIGHAVEVEQDDGSIHATTINAVTPADGTVTLTAALTQNASTGNRIRRIFGSAVTMNEYGTPKLETVNWGFKGILASNHNCQIIDQEIDIEITFIGTVAGGKDLQQTLRRVIREIDLDG